MEDSGFTVGVHVRYETPELRLVWLPGIGTALGPSNTTEHYGVLGDQGSWLDAGLSDGNASEHYGVLGDQGSWLDAGLSGGNASEHYGTIDGSW